MEECICFTRDNMKSSRAQEKFLKMLHLKIPCDSPYFGIDFCFPSLKYIGYCFLLCQVCPLQLGGWAGVLAGKGSCCGQEAQPACAQPPGVAEAPRRAAPHVAVVFRACLFIHPPNTVALGPSSPDGDGPSPPSPKGDGPSPPSPDGDGPSPSSPEGDGPSPSSPDGDGPSPSSPDGDGPSPSSPEGDGPSPPSPEGDGPSPPSPDGDGPTHPVLTETGHHRPLWRDCSL
ncbi:PREDICTED: skin secretory protein xP2-like [Chinchilla lanigera]|uniref:skin secretory protein xP2-like n=1 Tax=Chinchilla lanigera TaxID=34839 RepID=UPI0006981630|nr:PREDICTED: skin secretory protein xP2-like [Chinchilla lanigera]